MTTLSTNFDAIVIGGGSGGLAFATRAATLGASVALVEKGSLGGTCVNRGCVPKKLMWQAARWSEEAGRLAEAEIASGTQIDFTRMRQRSDAKIDTIQSSHESDLKEAGVTLMRGEAVASMQKQVNLGKETYRAERLILATGATPAALSIDGAELSETSDDLFTWDALPDRLLIVGGGYIGCEMAAILNRFGVEVTLVHSGPRLLAQFTSQLAQFAEDALLEAGVRIIFEDRLSAISEEGGALRAVLESGEALCCDRVLNATGREPNIGGIGPLAEVLERAESGALAVDARLMTSQKDVFAIGDVADRLPLTPVATRDGTDLADDLFGDGAERLDLSRVAQTAFVLPPVAQVGSPQGEGERGADLADGVTGAEDQQRFLYNLTTAEDGTFSGAELAGEHAAELIGVLAAMLGKDGRILRSAEAIHPSFSEELIGR